MRSLLIVLLLAVTLGATGRLLVAAPDAVVLADTMTVADHVNLERNLRWILAREREGRKVEARVGVLADAGAWNLGARSLVEALEREGVPCRVLDATLVRAPELARLEALVLPGGWSYFQSTALGAEGQAAIARFVEGGGRCLGICAGAFLVAKDVLWEGQTFPYPIALFDGAAEGPLAGLAPWPVRAGVRLTLTDAGRARGLAPLAGRDVLYYGGPRFLGGTDVVVLATYPDGTAAIVARRVGKGEVVLTGPHLERPAPKAGGDDAPAPADTAAILKALLARAR